jgi:hypothetical protein
MTARIGGIWKRGRLQKKWIYHNGEDLKVMGIRNCHRVARDRKEWRRTVSDAKSTTDCSV